MIRPVDYGAFDSLSKSKIDDVLLHLFQAAFDRAYRAAATVAESASYRISINPRVMHGEPWAIQCEFFNPYVGVLPSLVLDPYFDEYSMREVMDDHIHQCHDRIDYEANIVRKQVPIQIVPSDEVDLASARWHDDGGSAEGAQL